MIRLRSEYDMSKYFEEIAIKQRMQTGIVCDRCSKHIPFINGGGFKRVKYELSGGSDRELDICKPCFSSMFDFVKDA